MKNRWHAVAAISISLCIGGAAAADEKQICVDAYKKAQDLKDTSSLLAARDSLRACGNASCTAFIVKDCTDWLVDIERRIPTVIFAAKTESGESMVDVTIATIGGKGISASIDGKAREIDPGTYQFEFATADGRKVVAKAVVLEGQKGQVITATFPAVAGPPKPTPEIAPVSTSTTTATASDDVKPSTVGKTQRTAGLAVAGVGAAVTIGAVIVGLSAQSKNNSAKPNCPNDLCDAEGAKVSADARSLGNTSKILFGLGGAALAGGVVLYLVAPKSTSPTSQTAQLTMGLGSVSLTGRF